MTLQSALDLLDSPPDTGDAEDVVDDLPPSATDASAYEILGGDDEVDNNEDRLPSDVAFDAALAMHGSEPAVAAHVDDVVGDDGDNEDDGEEQVDDEDEEHVDFAPVPTDNDVDSGQHRELPPRDVAFDAALAVHASIDAAGSDENEFRSEPYEGGSDSDLPPRDVAFDLVMHAYAAAPAPAPAPALALPVERVAADSSDDGIEDDDERPVEIIGDEVVDPESPGFEDYLAARAAASRPIIAHPKPVPGWRQWQIDFGPAWAPAGSSTTITVSPQVMFRGEKIIATDTAALAGTGTRIMSVAVGQKVQRPAGDRGTLTKFFAETALANGIKFDTAAHRWTNIKVTVSFIQACTFDLSIFGTAIIE